MPSPRLFQIRALLTALVDFPYSAVFHANSNPHLLCLDKKKSNSRTVTLKQKKRLLRAAHQNLPLQTSVLQIFALAYISIGCVSYGQGRGPRRHP